MLDITGNDIANLNDSDMRSLIGLLCEAELRARNISTAGVTWGGHQNAGDGGIDIRVEIEAAIDGYIPRPHTGYQIKATDMPRSKIMEEICPKGEVRPSIAALAGNSGAYIIVSSIGSTTDTPLQDRKQAMHDAVVSLDNASK